MGGPSNVCMKVTDQEPWLKPFDRFDDQGFDKPDGKIDESDLKAWVRSLELPYGNYPTWIFPKTQYCSLFRGAMLYEQFLHRVVKPEMERSAPFTEEERELKASLVFAESARWYMHLKTYRDTYIESLPVVTLWFKNVPFSFFTNLMNRVGVAETEVLRSMHYRTPLLNLTQLDYREKPAAITRIVGASSSK